MPRNRSHTIPTTEAPNFEFDEETSEYDKLIEYAKVLSPEKRREIWEGTIRKVADWHKREKGVSWTTMGKPFAENRDGARGYGELNFGETFPPIEDRGDKEPSIYTTALPGTPPRLRTVVVTNQPPGSSAERTVVYAITEMKPDRKTPDFERGCNVFGVMSESEARRMLEDTDAEIVGTNTKKTVQVKQKGS